MGKLSPILKKVNKALDMREAARMKRAEEMGFDTSQTYYHGTAGNIDAFDPEKLGATTGARSAKKGYFFTADPDTADAYAEIAQDATDTNLWSILDKQQGPEGRKLMEAYKAGDFQTLLDAFPDGRYNDKIKAAMNGAPNVLPVHVRHQNPKVWDAEGKAYEEAFGKGGLSDVINQAKVEGHDALIMKNFDDHPYVGKNPQDHIVTFDPSNIRSVNAAFDPAKKDSANLLAGLGGAGVTGGAILGSDESEAGAGSKIVQALVRGADDANLPDTGWRGGHTAPVDPEYHAPLHEINKTYPDDIYSPQAIRHYGHGDYAMDKESIGVIQRLRGRPDDEVDVFRAVPSDAPDEILPGDWVTLSENYARIHGEGRGDYKILKGRAKAKKLRTDGNSPHEFGYTGAVIPAAFGLGSMLTPEQAAAADSFAAQDNDGIYADEYPTLDRIGTALNKIELPIMGKPLEGTGRYLQRFGEPRTKWQQLKDAYGAAFDFL